MLRWIAYCLLLLHPLLHSPCPQAPPGGGAGGAGGAGSGGAGSAGSGGGGVGGGGGRGAAAISSSPAQVVFTVGSPPSGSTPPQTLRHRKYSGGCVCVCVCACAVVCVLPELFITWTTKDAIIS